MTIPTELSLRDTFQFGLTWRRGMTLLLLSLFCSAVGADVLPARSRPPSFEYAQCFNACQIERDRLLSVCSVPDNPNRPLYDKPLNCTDTNKKEFLACLSMCPADTGAEDVP